MSARLLVDLNDGRLEVEADEAVVLSIYEDLKAPLRERLTSALTKAAEPAQERAQAANGEPTEEKRKRTTLRRGGPSCASRIAELDGFFSELRDTKAVVGALATKGHNYETKHVAAALINMTKGGKLRRIQKDGTWMYQNP